MLGVWRGEAFASVCQDDRVDELITPILRTDDATAAKAWYARPGFTTDWEHRFEPELPLFVSISRGPMRIFLSEYRAMPARTR